MLTQKDSDMAQVINLMTQLQRTEFALDQAKAVTRKHWEAMLAAEAQEGEARQAYMMVRSEVERLVMQGLQVERVSITPAPVLKTTAEWQMERETAALSAPIKPWRLPAFSFKQDPPPYFAVDMAKVCTVERGRVARAEIHKAILAKHKIIISSINAYLRRMVAQGQLQQIGMGHFAHKDWRHS